ncbi:MAG: DNA polymerase I, partial [Anaerolineae bacterium]|nr:DNA polymerase I [Anaerolineae bacterium]
MLFILDGHALAYRHYFAQSRNQLATSSGEPTGAIYGFARTLLDILIQDKPTYLVVAFDEGMSGRDTLYPAYKGTREKMPEDLALQMRRIRQLVETFNIPILAQEGYEADDLMGTVAQQAAAQGIDVRIITGDRDLLQLLDEHVTARLAIPVAGKDDEIYDVARFREKWGFEPRQLIDYKAMVGDTSDNIPGVSGIGDKGATALIQQFGSLDAIYANIDQLAAGVQKKLEAGRDSAYLSYQLATIHTDLNVTFDAQACIAHDFDDRKVRALFEELQFRTLIKQLNTLKPPEAGEALLAESDGSDLQAAHEVIRTVIVDDEPTLRELVETLNAAEAIAFDTETTGIDQTTAQLVGL